VSFTLTRDEFLATWRRIYAKQWRSARLSLLWVVLAILGVLDSIPVMIGAGVLVAFVCPLAGYLLTPRDLWRRVEQGPQVHTFAAEEITAVLPSSETRYRWDYWQEAWLVADTYVLRCEGSYSFIPRRAFAQPEDEERFRALIAQLGYAPG
jgi:YcxB-like protein